MSRRVSTIIARIGPGDWIALTALVVALGSFGWQVYDAWIGADVRFLSMKERTAELWCHTRSKDICWGTPDDSEAKNGRLTVVLPVFFSNSGAVNYNAIVDRVTAEVQYQGRDKPVRLIANQFWQLVQSGGSQNSRPFVPFVIEGKKANGAELRFAPYEEQHFVNWRSLASEISMGKISEFHITVTAHLVDREEPLTQSCRLEISPRLQGILEDRMKRRSRNVRLSMPCK